MDEAASLAAGAPYQEDLVKRTDALQNNRNFKKFQNKILGKKNLGIDTLGSGNNGRGLLGKGLLGRNNFGSSLLKSSLGGAGFGRLSHGNSEEKIPEVNQEINNNRVDQELLDGHSFDSSVPDENNLGRPASIPVDNSSNGLGFRGRTNLGSLLNRKITGSKVVGLNALGSRLLIPTNMNAGNFRKHNFDDNDNGKEKLFDASNLDNQIANSNIGNGVYNLNRMGSSSLLNSRLRNNQAQLLGIEKSDSNLDSSESIGKDSASMDNVHDNELSNGNIFDHEPVGGPLNDNVNTGGLVRSLSSGGLGRGSLSLGRSSLLGTGVSNYPGGRGRGLSLSIDASMKVLRQALLFKSALLKQREQLSRARENHEYLQSIGKRSISNSMYAEAQRYP